MSSKMQDLSDNLERVQTHARALARSGEFVGWRAVAFELRFEPDCLSGLGWLRNPAAQDEIDDLCREARARPPSPRDDPRVRDPRAA